jgi:CDGSH-type Zn-finger protein
MSEAVIVQKNPYPIDVVEGKTYYWCQCGLSKKQPFCDSSHKGTSFKPIVFKATKTKTMYFCGCKNTSKQPFCDGSHSSL